MSNRESDLLRAYGWDARFQEAFAGLNQQDAMPGRVISERRGQLSVQCGQGQYPARAAGRLLHQARDRSQLPAVGDWVALHPHQPVSRIEAVLPRRSQFQRKSAGRRSE